MSALRPVTLVGVGGDGRASLTSRALEALGRATLLAGGERHLALFPDVAAERLPIGPGIDGALQRIRAAAETGPVAVLASGDPLFFGIGARLVEAVGAGRVEVLPQPTSIQWAFARLGLAWDDAALLSLHGRPRDGFLARLRRRAKVACFTDAANDPASLARYLLDHGETGWTGHVCERLGETGERVRSFRVEALAACGDVDPLNVLILVRDAGWRPPPVLPFLPDGAFSTRNGLLTKREVRIQALAALGLGEASVLWDVGAGSGSIAVEAALLCPEGSVHAVERDPEMLAHLRANIRAHRADNVRVVEGEAPRALADLPPPDAVFVGGSGGNLDAVLARAMEALRPGGRLVVSAVLLDTLEGTRRFLANRALTPEVTVLNVQRGVPIAQSLRLQPLDPITLLAVRKPAEGAA